VAEADTIKTKAIAAAEAKKVKFQAEAFGFKIISQVITENPNVAYYLKLHTADTISRNLSNGKSTKMFLPNTLDQLVGTFSVAADAIANTRAISNIK
jgi:regulator of protease activity HflC (stomatin/prohibitin superfamily)